MDAGAFEDFYADGYARLVAAIGLVTGSREEAQDAVDEALARAWGLARGNRAPDELGAWVRVVALNVARGGLRRRQVDACARSRIAATADAPSAAGPASAAVDVARALARLTRRQREVVVLRYFCDLPVDDIAGELDVTPGSVKTLLHRARATLSDVLADREEVNRAR
ncbi:MAG TPA: sigma-70 family RNA polymerase sigma factor [Acidimicrobiia bacterium]|nr:sigma-70 family RNA polymerase sigma factor [Acidimicrobiia bacterium]